VLILIEKTKKNIDEIEEKKIKRVIKDEQSLVA